MSSTWVHIMVGLPGSGKSTYARNLSGNALVCEADDYFINPASGEYCFDPSRLGEAHNQCFRKYLDAIQRPGSVQSYDNIVVANTNLRLEHITPYVMVANALGAPFSIVRMNANPEVCHARNVHGVPYAGILRMYEAFTKLHFPKEWSVIDVNSEV